MGCNCFVYFFFVLFAGAMERDGTDHKKGLRGLGKKKTGRDAYRPVFFLASLPLPPLSSSLFHPRFFTPSSLRFRAMFFYHHQNIFVVSHTYVHIVSKDLDELR